MVLRLASPNSRSPSARHPGGVLLATLVIGLREGLEAALVVGVIAAFLRRHGRSLTAMWVGVAAAVATSAGIAVGLWALETTLPQAAQEGLEAVIGVIAVGFVTAMLVWMSSRGGSTRGGIERDAAEALRRGTALALAGMAYLAVVKEGAECGIFLLAAFRATTEPALAVAGASVGLAAAVGLGVGIFSGAVRLDLRRFYRWSAPVLVLLAGGLILTSVRKAHEAGWIVSGQQQVADLSRFAPRGSIQGALITGTLGVPADPRLVEVVAWAAYILPTLVWVYRPASWRSLGRRVTGCALAAVSTVAAAAVAVTLVVPQAADAEPTASTTAAGAAAVRGGVAQVQIRLRGGAAGDECVLDHGSAPAGPVTFTVVNESAPGLTELELLAGERIVGEKENLAPGLGATTFTSTLPGGRYRVYCPGAVHEAQSFAVTGTLASSGTTTATAALTAGAASYRRYAATNIRAMVAQVERLQSLVDAGDVAGAKAQYASARRFYERVESDVSGFVVPGGSATDNASNLDYRIDMRATNLDPAVGWHGFHAVERDLWQRGAITAETRATALGLVRDVRTLASLAGGPMVKPEDLANGAAGLMEEVQSSKIRGTEEAYSHLDLVDFAANVEGAQQAFANLEPGLRRLDPALAARIDERFAAVQSLLQQYRSPDAGGYRAYTSALRASDGQRLSQTVQALQGPLSEVAGKVAAA